MSWVRLRASRKNSRGLLRENGRTTHFLKVIVEGMENPRAKLNKKKCKET